MSLERNILNQCIVEPNPATAGFGSIVGHPSAALGGQDDSICTDEHHQASSNDHRGESQAHGGASMSLNGSHSRGLEQACGGYGDNRGRARKLYDATSAVEGSATCFGRLGTYQLGSNEAQSDVTSQAQTAWQEKADAAKAL